MLKYFHANVFPSAFTNGLSCPPVQNSLSCSLIAGTHVITSFCLQARLEIVSVWYGTRSSPSALPPHQRGQASDAQPALNLLGNSVVHGPWRVAWRGRNMKQGAGDLFQYFAEVVQQLIPGQDREAEDAANLQSPVQCWAGANTPAYWSMGSSAPHGPRFALTCSHSNNEAITFLLLCCARRLKSHSSQAP